jgi:hypothetical protein
MGENKKAQRVEVRSESIFERARARIHTMLALIATSAAVDAPKYYDRGSHHPGPIGHGKACHVNHSQRERGNRRSAKRAARVRRRG